MANNAPSSATVLATHWTFIAIAFVMISARLYLRLRIKKARQLILSDLLLVAAWCGTVTTAGFDFIFYKKNVMHPNINYTLSNFDASPADFEYILRMLWANTIPFYAALYLCKASLLAVYAQIFPIFMVKRRFALWVTVGYCTTAFTISISLQLFLCWPIQRNWQITKPETLCGTEITTLIFQISWALHFVGSILIITLPFSVIQNLQMNRNTKASVYGIFLLGAIGIAFSLTRFLTIQLRTENDVPAITLVQMWSALEVNVGIIVTCLPYLHPYVRRNKKSTKPHLRRYNTFSNKTTTNPWPTEHQFEEINGDIAGKRTSVNMIRKSPDVGETTLSPDLARMEPWNSDNRSEVELVELDRISSVHNGDMS